MNVQNGPYIQNANKENFQPNKIQKNSDNKSSALFEKYSPIQNNSTRRINAKLKLSELNNKTSQKIIEKQLSDKTSSSLSPAKQSKSSGESSPAPISHVESVPVTEKPLYLESSKIFSSITSGLINGMNEPYVSTGKGDFFIKVQDLNQYWDSILLAYQKRADESFIKYLESVYERINKSGNEKTFQYYENADYTGIMQLDRKVHGPTIINITALRALQFGADCHRYGITPCFVNGEIAISIPFNLAESLLEDDSFLRRHANVLWNIQAIKITNGNLKNLYNPMEELKKPKIENYHGEKHLVEDRGYKDHNYKLDSFVLHHFAKTERLFEYLPNLKTIDYSDSAVRYVYLDYDSKIENVFASNCNNLTGMNLRSVKKVECHNNPHLKTVSANRAETIKFTDCPELVTIDYLKAKSVILNNIGTQDLKKELEPDSVPLVPANYPTDDELSQDEALEETFFIHTSTQKLETEEKLTSSPEDEKKSQAHSTGILILQKEFDQIFSGTA